MKRYIFLGMGGAFGALARYLIRNLDIFNRNQGFPYGTLVVNITGAFLIAFIMTLAFEIIEMDVDVRIGIVTGFLGGFTTFSTLTKEMYFLWLKGEWLAGVLYSFGSLFLGLIGVYAGVIFVRYFFRKTEATQEEADL